MNQQQQKEISNMLNSKVRFNEVLSKHTTFGIGGPAACMAFPSDSNELKILLEYSNQFNIPVVCFVDTPGAYPGLEAEERGQGEAIARNILEMSRLKTPIMVMVIGEGASGGALGIGVGDRIFMLENTWYSVISPEDCASILFRDAKSPKEILNLGVKKLSSYIKTIGLYNAKAKHVIKTCEILLNKY